MEAAPPGKSTFINNLLEVTEMDAELYKSHPADADAYALCTWRQTPPDLGRRVLQFKSEYDCFLDPDEQNLDDINEIYPKGDSDGKLSIDKIHEEHVSEWCFGKKDPRAHRIFWYLPSDSAFTEEGEINENGPLKEVLKQDQDRVEAYLTFAGPAKDVVRR